MPGKRSTPGIKMINLSTLTKTAETKILETATNPLQPDTSKQPMNTTIKKYCQRLGITVLVLSASAGASWAQNVIVDQLNAFNTESAEVSAYGTKIGMVLQLELRIILPPINSITFGQWTYTGSSTPAGVVSYRCRSVTAGSFVGKSPTLDLSKADWLIMNLMRWIDPMFSFDNSKAMP